MNRQKEKERQFERKRTQEIDEYYGITTPNN